jgi:cytoskeletal protein CcmA (bactofilin family)
MFKKTDTSVAETSVKRSSSPAHTLISRDTEVIGDIHFSGELIIEGRVRGSIFAEDASESIVRVAEKGTVEGEIKAPSAVVNGLVQGNVHCSKHIELASKAIVVGDLHYNMIEMVLGSEVNGKLVHITAEEGGVPRLSDNTEPAEQLDLTNSETP